MNIARNSFGIQKSPLDFVLTCWIYIPAFLFIHYFGWIRGAIYHLALYGLFENFIMQRIVKIEALDPAIEIKCINIKNCNVLGSAIVPKFEKGAEEERQFIFRRTNRV